MGLFKKVTDTANRIGDSRPSSSSIVAAIGARTAPPDVAEKLRYAQLAQKLMASGVDAPAVVNSITPGQPNPLGGGIDTVIEITIKPADGDAYAATVHQSMTQAGLDTMSVGDPISVRYDPDDPTAALIYKW